MNIWQNTPGTGHGYPWRSLVTFVIKYSWPTSRKVDDQPRLREINHGYETQATVMVHQPRLRIVSHGYGEATDNRDRFQAYIFIFARSFLFFTTTTTKSDTRSNQILFKHLISREHAVGADERWRGRKGGGRRGGGGRRRRSQGTQGYTTQRRTCASG